MKKVWYFLLGITLVLLMGAYLPTIYMVISSRYEGVRTCSGYIANTGTPTVGSEEGDCIRAAMGCSPDEVLQLMGGVLMRQLALSALVLVLILGWTAGGLFAGEEMMEREEYRRTQARNCMYSYQGDGSQDAGESVPENLWEELMSEVQLMFQVHNWYHFRW